MTGDVENESVLIQFKSDETRPECQFLGLAKPSQKQKV